MLELLHAFRGDSRAHAEAAQWATHRHAERECDRGLARTTRHCLRKLPPRRRPLRLCMQCPRVANRIAWCWPDTALSTQVLEDLLQDRRGGRRSFAPCVTRELQRLREFSARQRVEMVPERLWATLARILGRG